VSRQQNASWGAFAIVMAAMSAGLAYCIFSANEAPTLPFAIAEYVLLGCALTGMFDTLLKCRTA
jgi:hypothetical protein